MNSFNAPARNKLLIDRELSVTDMLNDEIVQLLMKADKVRRSDVEALFRKMPRMCSAAA